jgi:hypothetical protein
MPVTIETQAVPEDDVNEITAELEDQWQFKLFVKRSNNQPIGFWVFYYGEEGIPDIHYNFDSHSEGIFRDLTEDDGEYHSDNSETFGEHFHQTLTTLGLEFDEENTTTPTPLTVAPQYRQAQPARPDSNELGHTPTVLEVEEYSEEHSDEWTPEQAGRVQEEGLIDRDVDDMTVAERRTIWAILHNQPLPAPLSQMPQTQPRTEILTGGGNFMINQQIFNAGASRGNHSFMIFTPPDEEEAYYAIEIRTGDDWRLYLNESIPESKKLALRAYAHTHNLRVYSSNFDGIKGLLLNELELLDISFEYSTGDMNHGEDALGRLHPEPDQEEEQEEEEEEQDENVQTGIENNFEELITIRNNQTRENENGDEIVAQYSRANGDRGMIEVWYDREGNLLTVASHHSSDEIDDWSIWMNRAYEGTADFITLREHLEAHEPITLPADQFDAKLTEELSYFGVGYDYDNNTLKGRTRQAAAVPSVQQLRDWREAHEPTSRQFELLNDYNMPHNIALRTPTERLTTWKIYNNEPVQPHQPTPWELREWLENNRLDRRQQAILFNMVEGGMSPDLIERTPNELRNTWLVYTKRYAPEAYPLQERPSEANIPDTEALDAWFTQHGAELNEEMIDELKATGLSRMRVANMTDEQRKLLWRIVHHHGPWPEESDDNGRVKSILASDLFNWTSHFNRLVTGEQRQKITETFGSEWLDISELNAFQRKQLWAIYHNRAVPVFKPSPQALAELETELELIPYTIPAPTPEESQDNPFLIS